MHINRTPEWKKVTPPSGWTWELPFDIQKRGRKFRPDPTFNLQSHANISVVGTYYVDKTTGNDANSGADWANALKYIDTAFAKADVNRVYVRNSWFNYQEIIPLPTRSCEIIATDDNVYFSSDLNNRAGIFSLVDNHYETTFSASSFVTQVYDFSNTSSYWWGTALVAKSSIAEVDATPGSYYYVYGATSNMYIHLFDDRAPDANMHYVGSASFISSQDNITYYIKGVHLWGATFRNSSSTGGLKAYLENCTIEPSGLNTWGVTELVLQSCTIFSAGDGNNIDARNGVITRIIEIDCDISNRSSASSDQASTGHNACEIVRINGNYHDVSGQVIADVSGCKTWCLGTLLSNSRVNKIGAYTGGTMWLDNVHISGCDIYDIQNEVGSSTYIRNCILEKGVNQISGTLATY